MNRKARIAFRALGVLLIVLAGAVVAQEYDLSWWTVDGGDETSSEGGGYELSGTIGQHDAGELSGGGNTLTGGFWAGVCVCPADLNGDCEVGPNDLAELLAAWGPCPEPCTPGAPEDTCDADLNGDCDVGPADLAMLLASWGPCP